jgi:hypothetical protein
MNCPASSHLSSSSPHVLRANLKTLGPCPPGQVVDFDLLLHGYPVLLYHG